jgi:hypothetical protein
VLLSFFHSPDAGCKEILSRCKFDHKTMPIPNENPGAWPGLCKSMGFAISAAFLCVETGCPDF